MFPYAFEVGADCFIYPGVRIGQPGFGFGVDAAGPIEMPQLGRVIIGDNVEIGANTAIDEELALTQKLVISRV